MVPQCLKVRKDVSSEIEMSELLKCAQCGNKIRQLPGARFTVCSYCGFQTNFEQPKPAPVYNDYSDDSTTNVYSSNIESPEPSRISRIDPRTGRVTYQDQEVSSGKFIGLALLTPFTVGFAPANSTDFLRCEESEELLLESSQSVRSSRYRCDLDDLLYIHLPAFNLRILGVGPLRHMDYRFLGLESQDIG